MKETKNPRIRHLRLNHTDYYFKKQMVFDSYAEYSRIRSKKVIRNRMKPQYQPVFTVYSCDFTIIASYLEVKILGGIATRHPVYNDFFRALYKNCMNTSNNSLDCLIIWRICRRHEKSRHRKPLEKSYTKKKKGYWD